MPASNNRTSCIHRNPGADSHVYALTNNGGAQSKIQSEPAAQFPATATIALAHISTDARKRGRSNDQTAASLKGNRRIVTPAARSARLRRSSWNAAQPVVAIN